MRAICARAAALLLGLLATETATSQVTFPGLSDGDECHRADGVAGTCVSLHECHEYRTREDIARRRPQLCRFSGSDPVVCCSPPEVEAVTPTVNGTGSNATPMDCGMPFRELRLQKRRLHQRRAAPFEKSIMLDFKPPVVMGRQAILGKWPWMALLGTRDETRLNGRVWFCGGVLINSRYVLTAAHCLNANDAADTFVRIGDYDLLTDIEVRHQQNDVARVVRHPDYRGSQNDIALLELKSQVEFTDAVRPACLPLAGADHQGQRVDLAGWGFTEFTADTTPTTLREVQLLVEDEQKCEDIHRRVPSFSRKFPGGLQGTKICCVDPDGGSRDACSGDSGGPLVWEDRDSGRYQVIGIVSTGIGCGNPKFPGIYTKVSAYIDWINGVAV